MLKRKLWNNNNDDENTLRECVTVQFTKRLHKCVTGMFYKTLYETCYTTLIIEFNENTETTTAPKNVWNWKWPVLWSDLPEFRISLPTVSLRTLGLFFLFLRERFFGQFYGPSDRPDDDYGAWDHHAKRCGKTHRGQNTIELPSTRVLKTTKKPVCWIHE